MVGWLLAMAPLSAFGLFLARLPAIGDGSALAWRLDWIPSLGQSSMLHPINSSNPRRMHQTVRLLSVVATLLSFNDEA